MNLFAKLLRRQPDQAARDLQLQLEKHRAQHAAHAAAYAKAAATNPCVKCAYVNTFAISSCTNPAVCTPDVVRGIVLVACCDARAPGGKCGVIGKFFEPVPTESTPQPGDLQRQLRAWAAGEIFTTDEPFSGNPIPAKRADELIQALESCTAEVKLLRVAVQASTDQEHSLMLPVA